MKFWTLTEYQSAANNTDWYKFSFYQIDSQWNEHLPKNVWNQINTKKKH